MLHLFTGYIALYFTIWVHEIGHAYMYKRYGCKDNILKVTVPFYLFFSTPAPIDVDKLQTLSKRQRFNISIAGIVVNLSIGIPIFAVLNYLKCSSSNIFHLFIYLLGVFNLLEAATYLTVNNIFLASDMEDIAQYNKKLRLPCFLLGSLAILLLTLIIVRGPKEWQFWTIVVSIIVSCSMGLGRVIFSLTR